MHATFTKTGHLLGPKASLYKFQRTEITHIIFSEHSGTKLEINNTKL